MTNFSVYFKNKVNQPLFSSDSCKPKKSLLVWLTGFSG